MTYDGPATARRFAFAPIVSSSRSEAIVQRIAEAIMLGLLADGEQLPSESDLASQLGVSTMALREALSVLREQGLVQTRRGRHGGSFVRRPEADPTAHLVRMLGDLSVTELRELGDEELAIAGACAALAARRVDPDGVVRLRRLADGVLESRDGVDAARRDSRFHIEVAVASQSERLLQRQISLQAEYVNLLWIGELDKERLAATAAAHGELADAIAAEDEPLARRLAEAHAEDDVRHLIQLHLGLS